jgi:hypothetical protein
MRDLRDEGGEVRVARDLGGELLAEAKTTLGGRKRRYTLRRRSS